MPLLVTLDVWFLHRGKATSSLFTLSLISYSALHQLLLFTIKRAARRIFNVVYLSLNVTLMFSQRYVCRSQSFLTNNSLTNMNTLCGTILSF